MTRAINIALPVPAAWHAEARRLAALAPQPNSVPVAADQAIPHITLAMGVLAEADMPRLAMLLREIANTTRPIELKAEFLYVKRDLGRRDFTGVQIAQTAALKALHVATFEALLEFEWQRPALGSFAGFPNLDPDTLDLVDSFRSGGTYDDYFPHITLAEGALVDGDAFFHAAPATGTELGLFAMGSLCTCRELLESYALVGR